MSKYIEQLNLRKFLLKDFINECGEEGDVFVKATFDKDLNSVEVKYLSQMGKYKSGFELDQLIAQTSGDRIDNYVRVVKITDFDIKQTMYLGEYTSPAVLVNYKKFMAKHFKDYVKDELENHVQNIYGDMTYYKESKVSAKKTESNTNDEPTR